MYIVIRNLLFHSEQILGIYQFGTKLLDAYWMLKRILLFNLTYWGDCKVNNAI